VSAARVAFVAGATGYTGRHVVAALRAARVETIAHVRPGSPALGEWRARFEALGARVDSSAWSEEAMRATLGAVRPDHVFALLGTTRARAGREGLGAPYEAIDYGLTALLLAGAVAAGNAPRFTYLSALGADPDARNPYLAVRGRLERELRSSALPFVIARPAFITGGDRDEFRLGERVASVSLDGVLGLLGALGARGLRDRYASLTGEQLARGLVAAALADRTGRVEVEAAALRAAAARWPAGGATAPRSGAP
jgi:uncharacterized protein YbjT (DUF2867 family)